MSPLPSPLLDKPLTEPAPLNQPSAKPQAAASEPAFVPAWMPRPNLLTLLLLVLIAANYFGTFADQDFAWQIRTADQIFVQGTLRPTDAFTYTIHGEHFPDFEWLYEVILYGICNVFGYG